MLALVSLLLAPIALVRSMLASHGTAEDVAAKWLRGIQNSAQDMQAGVDRVTVAPGQAAAAKKQKWINSLQDAAVQDKWERAVRSVSLSQWQEAMKNYGVNRVAQGAQAKQQKFVSIMGPLLSWIDQGVNKIKTMDDSTFEARIARSAAMQRWMHDFKRPSS